MQYPLKSCFCFCFLFVFVLFFVFVFVFLFVCLLVLVLFGFLEGFSCYNMKGETYFVKYIFPHSVSGVIHGADLNYTPLTLISPCSILISNLLLLLFLSWHKIKVNKYSYLWGKSKIHTCFYLSFITFGKKLGKSL